MCQAVCEPSHKQIRLLASPLRQQDPTGCSSVNQRRSVHLAPKMNASHLGEPLGTQVFGAISAAQMWPLAFTRGTAPGRTSDRDRPFSPAAPSRHVLTKAAAIGPAVVRLLAL